MVALIIAAIFRTVSLPATPPIAAAMQRGGGLTRRPSAHPLPAGATDAGIEREEMGDGLPPSRERTAGDDGVPTAHPLVGSAAAEPERDEFRPITGLHPHEDRTLAVLLCLADGSAHIARICDLPAADLEDDVPGLQPVL